MDKKNIATTIVLLLCSVVFTVVGSCFMGFIYADSKIEIKNPKVTIADSIKVYDKKDKSKTNISELSFSDATLGLKPVTGEPDADSGVPSTVTDKEGSEGVYATIVVTASAGLKVYVKNIVIESKEEPNKIKEERKNMFIGVKDQTDGAKNFEEDQILIISEQNAVDQKEYTIFFWLDGKADKILKGSKISFELYFSLN